MKITKQQIKELDNGNTTVRELFPEVFELKVGKWYKSKNSSNITIFRLTKPRLSANCGYGITYQGEWRDKFNLIATSENELREATEEEVFEALKKEAIKRGFKEGVEFNNDNLNDNDFGRGNIMKGNYFSIEFGRSALWITSEKDFNRQIFLNGVWAEIIEQPKENIIDIDGKKYKVTLVE